MVNVYCLSYSIIKRYLPYMKWKNIDQLNFSNVFILKFTLLLFQRLLISQEKQTAVCIIYMTPLTDL